MSTFAEARTAYDMAVTAEQSALDTLNSAKADHTKLLLSASLQNLPADDKGIIASANSVTTADTMATMAALRRSDAEATMHAVEIAELTSQAAVLVDAYAAAVETSKGAAAHARRAFEAAQQALADYWPAREAAAAASRDAHNFDTFIAARAASNPILGALASPDRPKTRLQAHGSFGQKFEVALIGPVGQRLGMQVFN